MKNVRASLLIAFVMLQGAACWAQETQKRAELPGDLRQFSWLVGEWVLEHGGGSFEVTPTQTGNGVIISVKTFGSWQILLRWDGARQETTLCRLEGEKEIPYSPKGPMYIPIGFPESLTGEGYQQWSIQSQDIEDEFQKFSLVKIDKNTLQIRGTYRYAFFKKEFRARQKSVIEQEMHPARNIAFDFSVSRDISISGDGQYLRVGTVGLTTSHAIFDLDHPGNLLPAFVKSTGLNLNTWWIRLTFGSGYYGWNRWHIERNWQGRLNIIEMQSAKKSQSYEMKAEYTRALTDPDGRLLAALYKNPNGKFHLHSWPLDGGLDLRHFKDLGEVQDHPFHFCADYGLLASTPDGLVRWNTKDFDVPPKTLNTGKAKHKLVLGLRKSENLRPAANALRHVVWRNQNGDLWITDFPSKPSEPGIWKLPGDAVAFDGEHLVYKREMECWTGRLRDGAFSDCKLLMRSIPRASRIWLDAQFLGNSGLALVSMRSDYVNQSTSRLLGEQSCLVNFHKNSGKSLMQSSTAYGNSKNLHFYEFLGQEGKNGNWLLGFSKTQAKIWKIQRNFNEEGFAIDSLDDLPMRLIVLENRWVIAATGTGVYALDLNASTRPEFIKFHNGPHGLVPSQSGRFATTNRDEALIWHVSQFQRLAQ